MKKYLATIFCIVVLAGCFALPAYAMGSIDADSVVMSVDEMTCVNYALDFAESYFAEIYGTSEMDGIFDYNLIPESSVVTRYIQERNYLNNIPKLYKTTSNYTGQFTVDDVKSVGSKVYCTIGCDLSYQYDDCTIPSGSGQPIFFTFQRNEENIWVLHDFYIYDTFDENNRGEIYYLDDYITDVEPIDQDLLNQVIIQQSKYKNSLNALCSGNYSSVSQENYNNVESVTPKNISGLHSLDKSAMSVYALFNCDHNLPESGNDIVTYTDLGINGLGGDCTNFISHCLLSGGAVTWYTGDVESGWYFYTTANSSKSWRGVSSFYNFVTTNTYRGPAGQDVPLVIGSLPDYDIGDIIQIDKADSQGIAWNHSTIITSFASANASIPYEPYVTSRSAPGVYDLNKPLFTKYGDALAYRVIQLDGYYS